MLTAISAAEIARLGQPERLITQEAREYIPSSCSLLEWTHRFKDTARNARGNDSCSRSPRDADTHLRQHHCIFMHIYKQQSRIYDISLRLAM